jgi:IS30 family transposase
MQISHEAIYRSLFVQTRGVLKRELTAHLRSRRRMRLPKNHNVKSGQGRILDMVSIRERPPRPRTALCLVIGKETLSPERMTHTSPRWSNAALAL